MFSASHYFSSPLGLVTPMLTLMLLAHCSPELMIFSIIFSVLFSFETFYSLWIQWLSPFLSILPQNLPSWVCFIVIIIFSVWKLYLIPLYIIYFLDDTWSLTLVKGVFAMVYSYICTVVKVSVKWFQHLHCLVTRVCYCLFHKGLLLPFPTWVEVGSLHIDPWNFK